MAWNRRGKVLGMIMCNLRAGLAAYQQAVELLPADAPRLLRVEILLGAASCESVAGDPARGAALLDQAASLVAGPDDTILAEMAHADASRSIDLLATLSHHVNFSVGCYCQDESHCHRSILRALIKERGASLFQ